MRPTESGATPGAAVLHFVCGIGGIFAVAGAAPHWTEELHSLTTDGAAATAIGVPASLCRDVESRQRPIVRQDVVPTRGHGGDTNASAATRFWVKVAYHATAHDSRAMERGPHWGTSHGSVLMVGRAWALPFESTRRGRIQAVLRVVTSGLGACTSGPAMATLRLRITACIRGG